MTLYYHKCNDCLTPFSSTERHIDFCDCNGSVEFMGVVQGDKYVKTENRSPCDGRCTHAHGPSCDCGNIVNKPLHYVKNNGCKSCGCLRATSKMKAAGQASAYSLYLSYKNGAVTRKLDFLLSFEEFVELTGYLCSYCGTPPSATTVKASYNGNYVYNGIDRVDNTIGYVFSNCRPCCKTCNYAKHTLGLADFLSWIKRLSSYEEHRNFNLSIKYK